MGRPINLQAPHVATYRANGRTLVYRRDHRLVYVDPSIVTGVLPFKCQPHMAIVVAAKLLGDGRLEATYSPSGNTMVWQVKEGVLHA